jgi:hypothetical protein
MAPPSKPQFAKSFLLLILLCGIIGGVFWGIIALLKSLPESLTTAVVTGGFALFVSTLTVVLARRNERRKELDCLYRDKKIEVYDEFLKRMFGIFQGESSGTASQSDLVTFMREHHRKLILWSGPKALHEFAEWMTQCRTDAAAAHTLIQMETFFLALREDLGHDNRGLVKGDLISLLLRNHKLFMIEYLRNPAVSLNDIAAIEKQLESGTPGSEN